MTSQRRTTLPCHEAGLRGPSTLVRCMRGWLTIRIHGTADSQSSMILRDGYDVARWLNRILDWTTGRAVIAPAGFRELARRAVVASIGNVAPMRGMLTWLALRGLALSSVAEQRAVARDLAVAIEAEDYETARAMIATARRRPDRRAEKVVSSRYRFLWICNPKVASRSILEALRIADPGAELVTGATLGELLA